MCGLVVAASPQSSVVRPFMACLRACRSTLNKDNASPLFEMPSFHTSSGDQ
jgi:hypothetical protein